MVTTLTSSRIRNWEEWCDKTCTFSSHSCPTHPDLPLVLPWYSLIPLLLDSILCQLCGNSEPTLPPNGCEKRHSIQPIVCHFHQLYDRSFGRFVGRETTRPGLARIVLDFMLWISVLAGVNQEQGRVSLLFDS